ncbi:PAS domain S-box-containing protein [Streptomyces sp. 2231.1]|uniref:SpoIIE family protein phosphatase n=1 Tax=Streptomyces sp. 2231.1 TaxID=1855347 RepID=UPI00089CBF95|nr:SpoIIE family protein phosphatase [Streptomyces sp. 2231.1]SEE23011.1 PAS domain S-box-containing protein [Streptomyces sp. 2231.1]
MAGETPLMVVDGGGDVVQWSHQAEELWGRPAGEVVGRPATDLASPVPAPGGGDVERCSDGGPRDVSEGAAGGGLCVRPVLRDDGSAAWGVFLPPADGLVPGVESAVLETLSAHMAAALFVVDEELHVVSANAAAQALSDASTTQIRGRPLTDMWPLTSPGELENMLCQAMGDGRPAVDHVMRTDPKNDSQHTHNVSVLPLRDARGAVVVAHDVTAQEKARRGVQALHAVQERVGQTLDVVATCQELVRALIPDLADIAVVEVVEPVVRGEEPPLSPLGRNVPLRRAAFGNSGGDQQARAHPVGDVRALPFPTPYAQALADLKPRTIALGPDTPWLAADPARAEAIHASGARYLLVAPLTLRGKVLGLLSLYRTQRSGGFDEKELPLTLELATHTALSIDNARRYAREHTIAATLQRHLLPPAPPSQTAIETADLYVADDRGAGGWSNACALPGARTALVVGEVVGHGIHTAVTMGQLRTAMQSLAALDLEPDELLARLDDTMTRLARERRALPLGDPLRDEPLSATCLCVLYDPFTHTCTIASAGHSPPVVAGAASITRVVDMAAGAALGDRGGPPYAATTVTLGDGDVLALYTASLLSAARPEDGTSDTQPLQRLLADTERPLQDLCDDILYRLRTDALPGDAILLLARTRPFPADRVVTWPLDDEPTAPALARRHARRQLTDWGVDEDTAYDTQEIVSELVTNALRYGAPPVRLRLINDRTLTCEVHDSGISAPRLRHARTVDEGGRGLFICAQLAHNWGIRYTDNGKTVWTEQALPSQHP